MPPPAYNRERPFGKRPSAKMGFWDHSNPGEEEDVGRVGGATDNVSTPQERAATGEQGIRVSLLSGRPERGAPARSGRDSSSACVQGRR